ncbi:MAG: hypothetical protein IJG19_04295 [Methanobrevibacter sp.]|nr:hypothetical protein [Methanobrevibacter sp.]
MNFNKKIFCALIVLIIFLSVNSVSAGDNVSDIIASDNSVADSGISVSYDEKFEVASTNVVTNATFSNFFTDEGELNGNVSAGSTLDFQGTFTGETYKVNITKPVNIISSTGDALFNEIGKKEAAGGCFHISSGGSGTNVTDLTFINSAFYVTNASDVSIENIYMMANMSGIGQSTGFMCVQAGSRYVTVKNSYFENRGTGSSIIVLGYTDYCTVDNNEVVINGSSGNAVYITTFVSKGDHDPTGNVISNNYIHGEASGFCMALVVAGIENTIEDNIIDYNGASGIAGQSFSTPANNTYVGNTLTGGCSFTSSKDSYVSGNTVEGIMNVAANNVVEDNDVYALSITGPNVVAEDNYVGEGNVSIKKAASNTEFTNNYVSSVVNVESDNNTIKNNFVETDYEYAVDLFTTTGNEVSYNSLVSNNLAGDYAVNATSSNSVHDNDGIDNIVTKDNFFYYFDKNGNYRNLNFTELIFRDDFDSLVDAITINKTLSIEGWDASLNNMAFILLADGISLNNLELNFDQSPVSSNGSAILINAPNVSISNITTSYVLDESANAYTIYAENADNLVVKDNNINFDVKNNGSAISNAVYVFDSSNVLFENNFVDANIPSCYVSWKYNPSTGGWVKAPLSEGLVFDECEDLNIVNNMISVSYNDVVGGYDTIYAIDITNSRNVNITDNNILSEGHTYGYALYVESEGLLVNNNNFTSYSDVNYANGIEIEASTDAIISNNNFDVTAPNFVYPIYSGMNEGDLEAAYIGNIINAQADIAYGMELCGSVETVYNNTINVAGNKTTALAVKSKKVTITDNIINALGDNLGNSTSPDSFAAMTVGINLQNSNAFVEGNTINSTSRGILANDSNVNIVNNEIEVYDNAMDDSYAIIAQNSNVSIKSNDITYVGATEGLTVNNAVNLNDCNASVSENVFDVQIPSCYVDWKEVPPGSGIWVKYPVSEGLVFKGCSDLELSNNTIDVQANGIVGNYDTIYAIDIQDSPNANVVDNEINAEGHSYIYGLYIEADDAVVDNNKFTIQSDENYANAIEVEASEGIVISNNDIEVTAPSFAYPIYSGMNGGVLEAEYVNNTIAATADIVYGMELSGTLENVINNEITVNGNKTTGLAVKSKGANITDNTINALGENLGNSTATDSFAPMTAAINLQNSIGSVERNTINSTSRGIFVEKGVISIRDNEINVEDNALDDSYAIIAENAELGIYSNWIFYVGNTNGSTVNNAVKLKDCLGVVLSDNYIEIMLPSCYVDWKEVPPGSGNWEASPVAEGILIESSLADVQKNNITVNDNGVVGEYDTIYAVHLISDGAVVSSNNIEANGHSYIYALQISGSGFVVENNTITADSDTFYANGINVEGLAIGVIKNNTIGVSAPGVTYAIYSAMSNGNVSVDYADNEIISVAHLAYGMELTGFKEIVKGNLFKISGDETIGILSGSKDVHVLDNTFNLSSVEDSTAFIGKSGNATITDNRVEGDGEYTVDVSKINALVKDNYLIAANLTGDASVNYNPETSTVYNNTPKMDKYFLSSEGLEKYFGNKKPLEFTLLDSLGKPVSNKTISIVINGKPYNRTTDANGTARININLNSGNYTVSATYENISQDANVTILPTIEGKDITKVFRNATQYEAKFVDVDGNPLKNTKVSFNINGVIYERSTDANGTAKLNINLPQGTYTITDINPVTGERFSNKVTVLSSIADNSDLTKYYKNDSQYVVKILGADGNPVKAGEVVTFNINGVFYNRTTNASGLVKLNINLRPGNYVITATYKGCSVANNITVLTTLETKDLSMKYKDGSTFDAKVLDGQGKALANKTVKFNVNGVFYDRVTGNDGIAKLKINLPAGQYIITSTYGDYGVGNKITISG